MDSLQHFDQIFDKKIDQLFDKKVKIIYRERQSSLDIIKFIRKNPKMNTLKQTKFKTITIYSRQQIASYFQQFKEKINQAYDRQDLDSIKQLLHLIRLTISLFQVPSFPNELNTVGDIQVTSYLEALYVKNTMWKNEIQQQIKTSVLHLINLFQNEAQGYKMTSKLKDLKYKKMQQHFSVTFSLFTELMYSLKEFNSITVAIDFLKVMVIHQIQSKRNDFMISSAQSNNNLTKEWISIVKLLIKYCRVIQSLKKQETAISICYWLCITQNKFISECINEGILNLLKRTLSNNNITESYGIKVINFLKLLINSTQSTQSFFSSTDFQKSIVKFSQRFDNQKMLKHLRELMNANQIKNNLNHKEKIQFFKTFSENTNKNEKELVDTIHLIGLYAQSDKLTDFIFNTQLTKFQSLIESSSNMQIFKQIFSTIAYIFSNQKGTIRPIELLLSKLKSIISSKSESILKQLTKDKKKLLINFLRMIKQILANKKYLTQVIESIKQNNLEKLFTNFSDCTNFIYEKQLLSFKFMLKSITKQESSEDQANRENIINALQKHLIEKSNEVKKLPVEEDLSEIKLLHDLVSQNPNSSELKISKELLQAISKKTYEVIESSSQQRGLEIFETGQNNKISGIKSEINQFALMFFNELFKSRNFMHCLLNEQFLIKNIKIGLNTLKNSILDEVVDYVILYYKNFGLPDTLNELTYELWKIAMEKSSKTKNQFFIQVLRYLTKINKGNQSLDKKIANFLLQLTQTQPISQEDQTQVLAILKGTDSGLNDFMKRLSALDPARQNLMSYLNCLYELSKQENLQSSVFNMFSNKLKVIYAKQVQSPNSSNTQLAKNIIYLILSQLVGHNASTGPQYFNEFLKITLIKQHNPEITPQSLIWVEEALKSKQLNSYEQNPQRFQDLFKFVDKYPQMIGIECSIGLKYNDSFQNSFMLKHKSDIEKEVEKSCQSMNLNFLQEYSSFFINQIFAKCSMITLFDKILQKSKHQFKLLNGNLLNEQITKKIGEGFRAIEQLLVIKKRSTIISGFVCSERIIFNENQYDHTLRQLRSILTSTTQVVQKVREIKLSVKNSRILVKTIFNFLTTFIHIFKNGLQSRPLTQQDQTFNSTIIKNLVQLQDKQINQTLSQLLRLMILKDKQRKFYSIQKDGTYSIVCTQLNKINTEIGQNHLKVCSVVLGWGPNVDSKLMTKMIAEYFLLQLQDLPQVQSQPLPAKPDSKQKSSQRASKMSLSSSVSDVDLIKYLKNLLHPRYTYGLNTVSKYMKPIRAKEYVETLLDVFILSSSLYEEDFQNHYCPLPELRQSMIDTVLGEFCDVNERLYIVLGMGREGACLGLKRKGIGVRGIEIICDKILQNKESEDATLYAQILTLNAISLEQLEVIELKKVPQFVNDLYRKKSIRPQYCIKIGNLIGQSSKLQQIQHKYSVNKYLIENLLSFSKNDECIAATLAAIAGVSYCNPMNQKQLGNQDTLKLIINYSINEQGDQLVVQKGFNALANIVIKNKLMLRTYFELEVQRKALKMLQIMVIRQFPNSGCIKQILRLLGIVALTSQGGFKLINLRYLDFARQLSQRYTVKKQYEIMKLSIDVLFNITNQTENDNRVTILKMHQQRATQFLISIATECALHAPIVSSCLQSLENLFNYDFILKQAITPALLDLFEQLSHTQQNSSIVFVKWFRLLYLIFKNDTKIMEIAFSNILFSASNYIRAIVSVDKKILQINMNLILKLKDKLKPSQLSKCGWIQFLIENLKSTNQSPSNLSQILDILIELTQKDVLSSFICTKLFQILIKRLQLEYRDENARKLIILLKKIKQKTSISSETAIFLLEFSCFFLTQKDIILSPRYHRRVREIISILAYFITFNIELKIVFRNQNVVSILRDWIKIDTLIEDETSIGQSCRLCLFAIYNDQNSLTGMRSVDILKQSQARDELERGFKCTLYRRDGSSKSAMIKLIKQRNELVAFKQPKGEIKAKYVIPLESIMIFRSQYEEEDDILYQYSVFPRDGGILSKKPRSELLVTSMGIVGQDLSIRSINIEFSKIQTKNKFVQLLKLAVTAHMNKRLRS